MAKGSKPKVIMATASLLDLTDECFHYEAWQEMPSEISKYWRQRYDLFALYDAGIHLTDAAWFGVTAQPIADQIAAELAEKSPHQQPPSFRARHANAPRKIVIDLFAGAGGNTLAFARAGHWDLVIGIERDAATLACAQHNAAVYELDAGEILWVHGDSLDFLRRLRKCPDTLSAELRVDGDEVQLFASPPWGGPMYSGDEVLDLDAMAPYGVTMLHEAMRPWAHAMFLPRNGNLNQLAGLVADTSKEKLNVVQYCINGSSKGMVAYYPAEHEKV